MNILKKIIQKIVGAGTKKPEESIVGTVISRLVPDKAKQKEIMLEIEKKYNEYEHEFEIEILKTIQDAQKMYEHEPKFSKNLKGSSRWIIALMFSCFYIFARLTNLELTSFDGQLMGGLWGFLFLSRGIEKILKKD